MGLKNNQLPRYIYHMRIIGYPPGWMKEAVLETSGLSLYDSDGKTSFEEETSLVSGIQYDASKFVNYPGFNSPVPDNYTDEWKALDMPPLQQHQQLSQAVKSPNIVINHSVCKRKSVLADNEAKKVKNDMNDCSDSCSSDIPENKFSSSENEETISSPRTPQTASSKSLSLSKSEGTPILEQGNPYNKLPDADKFAQGITEHLPFENLPDAVGKYEKMRGVLCSLQKKLHEIRS
ncbi:zinc finger CCHC domain-containing protein 8-like [Stegodyphus dumicola]|uniref:zinc finger CCHC domain-containing protein 8-like n=1 Tax=Stegodyphus dumicola TaxID=202533 RepID=UPI0015B29F65|nr:zinc finger CCHC domain-containing protein 8-like [Stegodyphus dumicola]